MLVISECTTFGVAGGGRVSCLDNHLDGRITSFLARKPGMPEYFRPDSEAYIFFTVRQGKRSLKYNLFLPSNGGEDFH